MSRTIAYHRPSTLSEATTLLDSVSEQGIPRVILGGGTLVNTATVAQEVVDLQSLDLAGITANGASVTIGAMTRLQSVSDDDQVPTTVREAAKAELPSTLRTLATMGGTVGAGSGESRLLAALLAYGAEVTAQTSSGTSVVPLSGWLDSPEGIIVSVDIAADGEGATAKTGRTPADVPIVCAVGRSSGDGITLAITGVADTPVLVDASDPTAGLQPPADFRGSSKYRTDLAQTLSARVIEELQS